MQNDYAGERSARDSGAMEQSHNKDYDAARQHLIEQRNVLIKSLASAYQREQTEAHIDRIVKIQSAIEIVDKAVDDERRALQRA